jgi:hypothetical protein
MGDNEAMLKSVFLFKLILGMTLPRVVLVPTTDLPDFFLGLGRIIMLLSFTCYVYKDTINNSKYHKNLRNSESHSLKLQRNSEYRESYYVNI